MLSPEPALASDPVNGCVLAPSASADHLLVSIIIPAYNAAAYLGDALASVLAQTYSNVEAVVVDDGSTDETWAMIQEWQARSPHIRVVRQENQGLPSARNSGLLECRGGFIAFLDADDVIHPEKVERQMAYLEAHPEVDLVYSDYSTADHSLNPLTQEVIGLKRLSLREAYTYTNVFPVMAPLLRRRLVDRVGLFDPALRACEDWDYWVRCERAGTFGYLPGHLSVYRMHGTQMHRDLEFMLKYARMAAAKNFPGDPESYRSMIGSLLWWQFGLRMQHQGATKVQALVRPRLIGLALRMVWEVRSVRKALHIRRLFRTGR